MQSKTKRRTRDFEKTRAEILKVAFWEVYTRGFQGISIDDIVAKTAQTKGAFYHHFPTKLDLGYALVDDVIKPMITDRWILPLDDYKNPVEGILTLLKTHVGENNHLKYGCPLNNLVQEMAPVDHGFKVRLEKALDYWIDEIRRQLDRAKANGYLKKSVNTQHVAQFVVMAHEGFYGIIKGTSQSHMFEALFSALKTYLSSLLA